MTRHVELPSAADIEAARQLVVEQLAPTPTVPVHLPGVDGEVWLKLESFQPTGSFKVRGALVAVAAAAESGRPVVTASAGNHGLGVAYAAGRLGVPATVVVPTTASPAKVDALRRLDVELVLHGDGYEHAERHALDRAEQGAVFVSAYNDRRVIAGQATLAHEVVEQVGRAVTLVVPVGGGGLLAGVALGLAGEGGPTRIVGVEAEASPAVSAAISAGRIVPVPIAPTLADGLAGNLEPGAVTPDAIRGRVHGIVPVDEEAIADAIRLLATECGVVAEGAAAVGVAALVRGAVPLDGPPVAVITGRHIAPDLLARVLTGGRS
ncbi:MAG TPA: pyridoxal-phosphate dependent enzyme [Acidimicrobiales bacterium]